MSVIDARGRVTIPSDVRSRTRLDIGCEVDVSADGRRIVVVGVTPQCVFCGKHHRLVEFEGGAMCGSCIAQVLDGAS